jgi:hypothetical protein
LEYQYNEVAALEADKAASRITEGGAYVGAFKKVWAVEADSGAQGIGFVFESPGNGTIEFTQYTIGKDGNEIRGANFVNAMMFMLGLKSLKSETGTIEVYDKDQGRRVEIEGEVFPTMCGKPLGLMFQRELRSYTNPQTGVSKNQDNLNLEAVFQPETRLLLSEIKERKTTPVKYDRMLKMCSKVKDNRKAEAAEPSQPSVGAETGTY